MQQTLKQPVYCEGVGLHSGQTVHLALLPAATDTGIVFKRRDIDGAAAYLSARHDLVGDTRLCTVLENGYGVRIGTVEHLMAALWGLGIDNALIELDGPEVPIMDGSSEPFVRLMERAGIELQDAPRRVIVVDRAIEVRDGEGFARLEPHDSFVLDIAIDFAHDAIGAQRAQYDFSDASFAQMLSRARTFGFAEDVERLRAAGLARGGSLENAVVVGEEGVMNAEGLRYDDEFVRHKALDCVGDYFLAGHRIVGRVTTYKPGHRLNNLLMRALLADHTAWHWEEEVQSPALAALTARGGRLTHLARPVHQAEK